MIHNFTRGSKKLDQASSDQQLSVLCFLRKYKDKQFVCGHNNSTEGLIVTQLSSNTRISV
jgi:hypothetical protein